MDLIADHISHRFGALEVLDDVSFVGAGEVSDRGPSGCARARCCRSWAVARGRGAAELPRAAAESPTADLRFQDFALLPGARWKQTSNFTAACRLTLSSADDRRHALRRTAFRISGTFPKQLSGGMRQRVASLAACVGPRYC